MQDLITREVATQVAEEGVDFLRYNSPSNLPSDFSGNFHVDNDGISGYYLGDDPIHGPGACSPFGLVDSDSCPEGWITTYLSGRVIAYLSNGTEEIIRESS